MSRIPSQRIMIYSSPRSALRHQNCAKVRHIARGAFCGSQLSFPRSPREHLAIFQIIIFFPPKHFALSPGKGFKILDCVMITEWEASGVAWGNAFRVQAEIRPRLKVEQESLASHTPDEIVVRHIYTVNYRHVRRATKWSLSLSLSRRQLR